MAVKICHASIDENGSAKNGSAGDQTGKEVCSRDWYAKGWDVMLRYPHRTVSKKAAVIAKKLASSNLVGYDQNQRNTLYTQLKKNNFNVDKYIKSGIKTETDCSAFVYACFCCVIPAMRSDSNAPTTSTMKATYKKYGFSVNTDSKYLTESDDLKAGDVLVMSGHHTVLVISDGSGSTSTTSESKSTAKRAVRATESAKSKNNDLIGSYTTTTNLNMRNGAGSNKQLLITLPKNTNVRCYGYYSPASGTKWLYVTASLNGVEYSGFCSSKYLKK